MKTTIYRIDSNSGYFYFGKTTTSLSTRMSGHWCEVKRGISKTKLYEEMRKGGQWIISEIEIVDKEESKQKEDEYITANRGNPLCLNIRRGVWTENDKKEYDRKWNEDHKERAKKSRHDYYEKNKEHLRQKGKEWLEQNKEQYKLYKHQWYLDQKNKSSYSINEPTH